MDYEGQMTSNKVLIPNSKVYSVVQFKKHIRYIFNKNHTHCRYLILILFPETCKLVLQLKRIFKMGQLFVRSYFSFLWQPVKQDPPFSVTSNFMGISHLPNGTFSAIKCIYFDPWIS